MIGWNIAGWQSSFAERKKSRPGARGSARSVRGNSASVRFNLCNINLRLFQFYWICSIAFAVSCKIIRDFVRNFIENKGFLPWHIFNKTETSVGLHCKGWIGRGRCLLLRSRGRGGRGHPTPHQKFCNILMRFCVNPKNNQHRDTRLCIVMRIVAFLYRNNQRIGESLHSNQNSRSP